MNKYCVNCHHSKKEYVQQNGRTGSIFVCLNQDFGDPVTGDPMPCQVVRANEHWCGLSGSGFKFRQEPVLQEKPIIIDA